MARKRQECGNHSRERLPPEEYQARAEAFAGRVAAAVRIAAEQLLGEPGYVGTALAAATVWGEIPGLGIDSTAVVVSKPSGQGRFFFSYTWDWLEAHPDSAIAEDLVAKVRKAATEASA